MSADVKKKVKDIIKEKSKELGFPGFQKKITSSGCKIYMDNLEIGDIALEYVSSKFSEHGSLFGVYAGCRAVGGKLASILEKMELSYPRFGDMPGYFSQTSLNERVNNFGEDRGGHVSFFEKDDLEEKCSKIIEKLNSIYVPRVMNFALGKIEVIDDILESPMDYAYPMASIIVACYLNDKKELVEQSIKNAKSKKLYDAGSSRVQEILEKVQKVLG